MSDDADLVGCLRRAVDDPTVVAVAIEHDLTPMAGPGAPVASPTYRGDPNRPVAERGLLPQPDDTGWLTGIIRDDTGRPVEAPSVVLDSVASQSGRAETALWRNRDVFGGLPGFSVTGTTDNPELAPLLADTTISSWQAAHRHVDAWPKYASDDGSGKPLWTVDDSAVRALIAGINTTTDATTAFRYAPNAMLFGFWLSAGTAQRHRQPRVYSCEIVGFGAREHRAGASKVEGLPVSNQTSINPAEFGMRKKSTSKGKPSELGFGPVPGTVEVTGHVCERIAARGAISLSQLGSVPFADDPDGQKTRAAAVVLTVLGLAGDALARQDTLLRSGCDLLPTASRYGLRRIGRTAPDPLPLGDDWTSPEWWAGQLEQAMADCRAVGLDFADPVELSMSQPQLDMLADGVRQQLTNTGGDE